MSDYLASWRNLDHTGKARVWDRMTPAEKDVVRSSAGLHPDLIGLEGWRVELTYPDGSTERGIVSRSTGWQPCHILLKLRTSHGGSGLSTYGFTIRKLYKVRS
jgi:hypothetical protein